MKLKKADQVLVISGKDRGKSGKIEKILPKQNRAIVAGINLAKKAVKPSKKAPKGGQIEFPAPIHISNLQYLCPDCKKPTKIVLKKDAAGKKLRVCKKCQKQLETNLKTGNQTSKKESKKV